MHPDVMHCWPSRPIGEAPTEKRCTQCGESKAVEMFHRTGSDGYRRARCAECRVTQDAAERRAIGPIRRASGREHPGLPTRLQRDCAERGAICVGCPWGGWLESGPCQVRETEWVREALGR